MDKNQYAARRASAETLPKGQRLRLAHPKDRAAAREDRKSVTGTDYWARGNQLAQAMLVTALEGGQNTRVSGRIIGAAKRMVRQAEQARA